MSRSVCFCPRSAVTLTNTGSVIADSGFRFCHPSLSCPQMPVPAFSGYVQDDHLYRTTHTRTSLSDNRYSERWWLSSDGSS